MSIWHDPCTSSGMSLPVALIAERDPSLRALMSETLRGAGYEVRAYSGAVELRTGLPLVATAECVLLVLHMELVAQCVADLCTLIRDRWAAQHPRAHLIFVCEFGALTALPNLGDYYFAGLLEKPFDFDDLQGLARGCRAPFRENQVNQA